MKSVRFVPVLAIALAGCPEVPVMVNVPVPGATFVAGGGGGNGSGSAAPAGPRVGEDQHYLQADDFFVADRAPEGGWVSVHLAKQRVAPTPGTKGQGQYFRLDESRDVWTEHAWLTRPANAGDLRVGAMAVCFEGQMVDGVYAPPSSKDQARTGPWFAGRITDTSDGFKGVYRVDTYNCKLTAMRVAR
jgi:hypothetical protein